MQYNITIKKQNYNIHTTMIAILPPTSPTTFIGGFSFAGCTGTPTDTSIVRDLSTLYTKQFKYSVIPFC